MDNEAFERLIREIRPWATDQPVLLSELGQWLRRVDPSFTPLRFGTPKLVDLLAQFPHLGSVDYRFDGHPLFRFNSTPLPRDSSAEEAEPPAPMNIGPLLPPIWRAVTDFNPPEGGWLFDLQHLRPAHLGTDGDAIAREPERFLQMPSFDKEVQTLMYGEFSKEAHLGQSFDCQMTDPPNGGAALDASSGESELGGTTEQWRQWRQWRQQRVTRLTLEWAEKHGIPRDRLLATNALPPGARRAIGAPFGSRSAPGYGHNGGVFHGEIASTRQAAQTRALLHRIIDNLSDSEVLNFPLPAWSLIAIEERRH